MASVEDLALVEAANKAEAAALIREKRDQEQDNSPNPSLKIPQDKLHVEPSQMAPNGLKPAGQ